MKSTQWLLRYETKATAVTHIAIPEAKMIQIDAAEDKNFIWQAQWRSQGQHLHNALTIKLFQMNDVFIKVIF